MDPRAAPLLGRRSWVWLGRIVRTGVGFRCDIFDTIWSEGRKDLVLLLTSLVLGSVLFSIIVNDIMAGYPNKNLLVKYTDDITIRSNFADLSLDEVQNIQRWSIENRMTLNLKKTWEMVVRGNTKKATHEGYWEEGGTQVIESNIKRGAMQLGHTSDAFRS